jgi:hypothetical protein
MSKKLLTTYFFGVNEIVKLISNEKNSSSRDLLKTYQNNSSSRDLLKTYQNKLFINP